MKTNRELTCLVFRIVSFYGKQSKQSETMVSAATTQLLQLLFKIQCQFLPSLPLPQLCISLYFDNATFFVCAEESTFHIEVMRELKRKSFHFILHIIFYINPARAFFAMSSQPTGKNTDWENT